MLVSLIEKVVSEISEENGHPHRCPFRRIISEPVFVGAG
jgi:hypothetical protein